MDPQYFRRSLLAAAALVLTSMPLKAQECPNPLALADVVSYARNGVELSRIITLMETRCATFQLGNEPERAALHEAGLQRAAVDSLIEALAGGRVRYVAPRTDSYGLPVAGSPIAIASDWIRAQGTRIFYRHEYFLNVPCSERFRGVGNWENDGWDYRRGARVECLNDAWLVIDLGPQIAARSIVPGLTYCVNITDAPVGSARANWGQHGNRNAPGLGQGSEQSFVVVGPRGERGIGFEVVRSETGDQIKLSNYHRIAQGKC